MIILKYIGNTFWTICNKHGDILQKFRTSSAMDAKDRLDAYCSSFTPDTEVIFSDEELEKFNHEMNLRIDMFRNRVL